MSMSDDNSAVASSRSGGSGGGDGGGGGGEGGSPIPSLGSLGLPHGRLRRGRRALLPLLSLLLPPLLHLVPLLSYVYPLVRPHPENAHLVRSPRPVLDESHILSPENADVRGTGLLSDVWRNDYWGRPMNSPSSHRSWRPLTVLTFRWGKLEGLGGGESGWAELFSHRLVSVIIHAAVAEIASVIATKLFPDLDPSRTLLMRCLVKLLFALHPAHVECTANAANRPHIISLLFAGVASDPDVHLLAAVLSVAAGLLCSETAIFQLPAVLATATAIRWKKANPVPERRRSSSLVDTMGRALPSLLPRYVVIAALGAAYLGGRYAFDALNIPDGLIRPAENPYYALAGTERAATYSLVLSIHIGKAFLVDWVGFSHEYGYDCVRKVSALSPSDDPRLYVPAALVLLAAVVTCECAVAGTEALVMWAVMLSWMATLFPVSGFVKVGTSIADRIAVPCTFAVCIFGGRALAWFVADFRGGWFDGLGRPKERGGEWSAPRRAYTAVKSVAVAALLVALWARVDRRASEWMDSVPLLESSLISCPRSAKSNLEISKIYSGLYPEKFDLEKALSFLRKAEKIDPDYCDLHQQFAHCYIQQGKYLEFEERLTKAVMCPFSMGGSVPLWQRYWQAVTSDPATGEAARKRMDKYQKIINKAIQKEAEKEEAAKQKQRQDISMDGEL